MARKQVVQMKLERDREELRRIESKKAVSRKERKGFGSTGTPMGSGVEGSGVVIRGFTTCLVVFS